MKVRHDLPKTAQYHIGSVHYEVRAFFPEEGPTLQEKVEQLLSKKARDAVCTFDREDAAQVK